MGKKEVEKESLQVLVHTVWGLMTQHFGLGLESSRFSHGLDENNTVRWIQKEPEEKTSVRTVRKAQMRSSKNVCNWRRKSSKIFYGVFLSKCLKLVHFICFVSQISPCKTIASGSQWEGRTLTTWQGLSSKEQPWKIQWKPYSTTAPGKLFKLKTTGIERMSIV